jgi:hypothetical protein
MQVFAAGLTISSLSALLGGKCPAPFQPDL